MKSIFNREIPFIRVDHPENEIDVKKSPIPKGFNKIKKIPVQAILLAQFIPPHKLNKRFMYWLIISLYDKFHPNYFDHWGIGKSYTANRLWLYKAACRKEVVSFRMEKTGARNGNYVYYRLSYDKQKYVDSIINKFAESWNQAMQRNSNGLGK